MKNKIAQIVRALEYGGNDWNMWSFPSTLFCGVAAAIVSLLSGIFGWDLIVFRFIVILTFEALLGLTIFFLIHDLHIWFVGLGLPSRADLILELLVFLSLLVSVATLFLSFMTRAVLWVPVIWAALFYAAVEVQSNYPESSWDRMSDIIPWRVRCVAALSGLVIFLALLSGQTLVTTPGQVLTWLNYLQVGIAWLTIWIAATFAGSILVGGINLRGPEYAH